MKHCLNMKPNTRKRVLKHIEDGKAKYLGILDTANHGVITLMQLGKLIIPGNTANIGFLPNWNQCFVIEDARHDPVESYVEYCDIKLYGDDEENN